MKIWLLLYVSCAAIFSRIYEGVTELKQGKIMIAWFIFRCASRFSLCLKNLKSTLNDQLVTILARVNLAQLNCANKMHPSE